jgi:hypothetical protein
MPPCGLKGAGTEPAYGAGTEPLGTGIEPGAGKEPPAAVGPAVLPSRAFRSILGFFSSDMMYAFLPTNRSGYWNSRILNSASRYFCKRIDVNEAWNLVVHL